MRNGTRDAREHVVATLARPEHRDVRRDSCTGHSLCVPDCGKIFRGDGMAGSRRQKHLAGREHGHGRRVPEALNQRRWLVGLDGQRRKRSDDIGNLELAIVVRF
eukprot:scaffold2058_cov115-Isochrysis_galbana.AAC.6